METVVFCYSFLFPLIIFLIFFFFSEIASPSRETKVFPMTSTLGSPLGILQLPSTFRISVVGFGSANPDDMQGEQFK